MRLYKYLSLVLLSGLCSCASYLTPGKVADLSTFSNPAIKEAYAVKPTIRFPAHLVVVRVQSSGYRNDSGVSYGSGSYSVVTTRDVEKEEDIKRIASLPGVAEVGILNRLLISPRLTSDVQIREAVAKLQADAVFLYTFSTSFWDKDKLPPLTLLTLGLAPTRTYEVFSTASALLMDARTGYIYGVFEGSDRESGRATVWNDKSAMEGARKKAEGDAYEKLLEAFVSRWPQIYERYSK